MQDDGKGGDQETHFPVAKGFLLHPFRITSAQSLVQPVFQIRAF